MISTASSTHQPTSTARHGGVLALEPPRHTKLAVAILTVGKHLIGADSSCSIQIQVDGIQRRHAMVLVGEQKVLLKALDPCTWVNDNIVSETSLRAGDRLSIGPITFRVRAATADELRSTSPLAAEKRTPTEIPIHQSAFAPAAEPQASEFEASDIETSVIAMPDSSAAEEPVLQVVEPELIDVAPEAIALPEPIVELLIVPEVVVAEVPAILIAAPIETESEAASVEVIAPSQQPEIKAEPNAIPEADLAISVTENIWEDEKYQQHLKRVEETRRELTDEFARQSAVWQEREAAHHRSVEELKQQLEIIAQQRANLQLQSEVVAREQTEMQNLQNNIERSQQADAIERRTLLAEAERLRAEREAFEADQHKQMVTLQEQMVALQDREARLASERESVGAAEEERFTFRKQLERERTQFAAERAEESVRLEQEIRDASAAQQRLCEQTSATQKLRFELQAEQIDLENRLSDLRRDQDEVSQTRIEMQRLQDELTQAKLEFERQLAVEKRASNQRDEGLASYLQLEMDSRRSAASAGSGRLEKDPISYPIYESPRQPLPSSAPVPPPIPMSDWTRPGFQQPTSIGATDPLLPAHRLDSGPSISMSADHSNVHGGSEIGPPTFTLSSMAGVSDQSFLGHMDPEFLAVNTASAVREAPTVSQTLTEVNQQFGLPMSFRAEDFIAQRSSPSATQAFESETELRPLEHQIDSQPLDESPALSPPFSAIPEKDNSLSSLRAQLAQMFDLPKDPQSTASDHQHGETLDVDHEFPQAEAATFREGEASAVPGTEETNRLGGFAGTSRSLGASRLNHAGELSNKPHVGETFESSEYASAADDSSTDIQSIEAASAVSSRDIEATAVTSPAFSKATNEHSRASTEAVAESTDEDDAWTRRLRELTAATLPPAPLAPKPAEEPEPSTEDDEEYSVEAQLARLLGRPQRTGTRPNDTTTSSIEHQTPKGIIGRDLAETINSATAEQDADRSHLTEQPKHRQNKNAVLQEVQSFRAVAQMSARLALAKHSWNNLRSEIYFKAVLAAVSAGATAWFATAWVFGMEPAVWKSLVCSLTTLICLERLFHSSSKIRIWKKKNKKQPAAAQTTVATDAVNETDA